MNPLGFLYGPPVIGGTQVVTLSGSDQSISLPVGAGVKLTVLGGDCFFAFGAAATTPADRDILPAGSSTFIAPPPPGIAWPGDKLLHVVDGPTAGGTLYVVRSA